jgi:mRNA interferase RelE/StbE
VSYRVVVRPKAESELLDLPTPVRERLFTRLLALGDDPRPRKSVALKGALHTYRRIRVGDYRVCYRIDDKARVVTVVEVGDRSRVYKDLARKG